MKIETKINLISSFVFAVFFGVIFTILGGLVQTGTVDWEHFVVTVLVGVAAGLVIGLVLPMGKWGKMLADKVSKPGKFLHGFIMNLVILIIMLVFMCPIFTVFIGSILYEAPVLAVLPSSYSLFLPFFAVGIVLVTIFGGPIMKLALKLAGVPKTEN